MRKLVIFQLFICLSIPLFSQISEKDSLQDFFTNIKSDSLLISELGKKAGYYRNRNSELHLFVIRKALAKANDLKEQKLTANFKRELGIYFRKKGVLDSAIYHYKKSLKIHTELKDSLNINIVKSSLANVFKAKGNYQKAIQYFNEIITKFIMIR
jgi:tetratricopeptide (TPR) repeat protein